MYYVLLTCTFSKFSTTYSINLPGNTQNVSTTHLTINHNVQFVSNCRNKQKLPITLHVHLTIQGWPSNQNCTTHWLCLSQQYESQRGCKSLSPVIIFLLNTTKYLNNTKHPIDSSLNVCEGQRHTASLPAYYCSYVIIPLLLAQLAEPQARQCQYKVFPS